MLRISDRNEGLMFSNEIQGASYNCRPSDRGKSKRAWSSTSERISEPAGQTDDKRIGSRNVFVRLPALKPTVLKSIDSASDGKTVGPLPPHN